MKLNKKAKFQRFPSFQFDPKNKSKTGKSPKVFVCFKSLIVSIALSVGKLKIFIEF